jgi:hypothetical protein
VRSSRARWRRAALTSSSSRGGKECLKEVATELTARYGVQARVVAVDLGRDGILGKVTEATSASAFSSGTPGRQSWPVHLAAA